LEESDEDIAATRRLKEAMAAKAKRRRQKQSVFFGSLAFVIVGLLIIAVWLASGSSQNTDTAASSPEETPIVNTPSESDATKKPSVKKDPLEAADLQMTVGDVPVRVVGLSRGKDVANKAAKPILLVTIEVKNRSGRDPLNFVTWSADAEQRKAALTDEHGKAFAAKPIQAASVLGKPPLSKVEPGATVRDILGFELPDASVDSLELELPGEAFGKNAAASFHIPTNLISDKTVAVRMTSDRSRHAGPHAGKQQRKPKPGTPEYDFGIGDDASPH
jgi:hypothetical protein